MQNKIKKTLCAILISSSIIASATIGDFIGFNDFVTYPIIYRNCDTEKGFTSQPYNLKKIIIKNENNKLETYFGNINTKEFYSVKEDDTTGSIIESLYYKTKNIYEQIINYFTK
jgi:hypothetical protein